MSTFEADLIALIPKLRIQALRMRKDPNEREDLVQAALLKAWEKRDKFEVGTSMHAWCYTIMYHISINQARAAKARPQEVPDDFGNDAIVDGDQEARLRGRDFWRCLAKIPSQQAEMLLANLKGDSLDTMVQRFRVPRGTVKSRTYRGFLSMRLLISGEVNSISQKRNYRFKEGYL